MRIQLFGLALLFRLESCSIASVFQNWQLVLILSEEGDIRSPPTLSYTVGIGKSRG